MATEGEDASVRISSNNDNDILKQLDQQLEEVTFYVPLNLV